MQHAKSITERHPGFCSNVGSFDDTFQLDSMTFLTCSLGIATGKPNAYRRFHMHMNDDTPCIEHSQQPQRQSIPELTCRDPSSEACSSDVGGWA